MSHGDDIEATIEYIVDERIISALDDYDPTNNYSFTSEVERLVDERVDNITLDEIGGTDYINDAVGDAITEALRTHLFTSEDVEDFDSAVLSVLQDQIDHNGPLDAPNNSDIERRVNDLEIQVASLLETNQRLLSALVRRKPEAGQTHHLDSDYSLVSTLPDFAAAAI